MSTNTLKLNKDKTELLYLFSKYNPQQSLPTLCFGTDIIKPSLLALSSIPLCQCFPLFPMSTMFVNLPFIIFPLFPALGNTYQRQLERFLFTPLWLPVSVTAILYYIMSLQTSSKSFNRCRMQLPDWLYALGSVITSLPSFSIFTGYLFLNELNSRFYYLPSRLCINNLQPIFKT